jgi:predicted ATPase/class 3 adenylate cyclase
LPAPRLAADRVGDLTVMITDLERSTELWEHHESRMETVIRAHNEILARAIQDREGHVLSYRGDGVLGIFEQAGDAVAAAVDIQRVFATRSFEGIGRVSVRIGINTGRCTVHHGELYGRPPNLAARLEAAGHGGQIVVSDSTACASAHLLAPGVEFFELGRFRFRGFDEAVVVHCVVADGIRSVFPPLRTTSRGLDELPHHDSPLIGREELIGRVVELVSANRLTTLWGPGGVGKTRVALAVAERVRRPFRQGVRYIDLSTIDHEDRVAELVATGLRAQPRVGESWIDTVARSLLGARLLLIVDGCEHVVDAIRDLVRAVTGDGSGPHVLVTSRTPLAMPIEALVSIEPLAVPERSIKVPHDLGAIDAVRLFVERARLASGAFEITAENAVVVAELCRALDGLPLALELAAARLDVETVAEVLASCDAIADEHDASHAGSQPRTRLVESLHWSYDRLSVDAASVFRCVAVFAGSFTTQMGAAIADDLAPHEARASLLELARASLISRDPLTPERFRMLETSREFARSVSTEDEWATARRTHAMLMRSRAEHWGPRIRTGDAYTATAILASDLPDHRRAVEWMLAAAATDECARMVTDLFMFGLFGLHADVYCWADELATRIDDRDVLASEVYGAAALGAWFMGDMERAIALGLRGVQVSERTGGSTIWARTALVDALGYSGRVSELSLHFQALVAEDRASDEEFWHVDGLAFQSISFTMFGQYEKAVARAERALVIARRLTNPYCMHWALYALGRALARPDPRRACEAFEASMRASREVDSRFNVALAMTEWLACRRRLGDYDDCVTGALDLLDMLAVSRNRSQMSGVLREVSHTLSRAGDVVTAATAMFARRGLPEMPADAAADEDASLLQHLRESVGDDCSRLEIRAVALPDFELIESCRSALLSVSAAG